MFQGNENYKSSYVYLCILKALLWRKHFWVIEAWDRLCTKNSEKPLWDFLPVYSKDDDMFQNIWSNSASTIFPFPNYYTASKFSVLATEYNYNIDTKLHKEKKKPCKHVFLFALNILIFVYLCKWNGYYFQVFPHANCSLFHI